MQIIHNVGHNGKWNLDSYFENGIGDGFIFNAYSYASEKFSGKNLHGYKNEKIVPNSFLDTQFYGSKSSQGGKLDTYDFHPIAIAKNASTQVEVANCALRSIKFQQDNGFSSIIIPDILRDIQDLKYTKSNLVNINKSVDGVKKHGELLFMSLVFSKEMILNTSYIEELLTCATDMSIIFDGYYIVTEAPLQYKQKTTTNINYYANLIKLLRTLNKQGFKTFLGYANWNALILSTLSDIDYLTIGTYENLRNFNIERFTEDQSGGPSEGWYYSEKLLNFIKASNIALLRQKGCLDLIKNNDNIFSDVILDIKFNWNTHKPDVHKNYLLSISRELRNLTASSNKISYMEDKIKHAQGLYKKLNDDYGVYLAEESSNYFLGDWLSLIKSGI